MHHSWDQALGHLLLEEDQKGAVGQGMSCLGQVRSCQSPSASALLLEMRQLLGRFFLQSPAYARVIAVKCRPVVTDS